MSDFNIDDVILLIHSEVATAVSSTLTHDLNAQLQLESVRIRMGQRDEEDSIAINHQRYPPSETGWLVDVFYDTKQQTGLHTKLEEQLGWIASDSLDFLSLQPIIHLDGIGEKRAFIFNTAGIMNIGQLAELDMFSDHPIFHELSLSVIRKLKTLATLSIAVPSMVVPSVLNPYKIINIIEGFEQISSQHLDLISGKEHQRLLLQWFERLEFCFDDGFFNTLILKQLQSPPI